jgi:hypothetical protein
MDLTIIRTILSEKSTIGELSIDSKFLMYSLEDCVRAVKIPGRTAISYGRFQMIINRSQRFGYDTPLLLAVPNFTAVRIHRGNGPDDTEGCILVGRVKGNNVIGESKLAFDALMEILGPAYAAGQKLFLNVEHGPFREPTPRSDGFVA